MFFFFPFGFGFFGTFILVFFLVKLGIYIFRDVFRDDNDFIPHRRYRYIRKWNWFSSFGPNNYRVKKSEDAEHQIFRLANKLKGYLTVSDIVIHTGLGIKEAEEIMNKLVDGIRVRMEVDDEGIVVYEFPEIIAKYRGRDTN